jgi:mRNA interferase RelE/StbE
MASYKLIYTDDAMKELEDLDNSVRSLILRWMRKNIENTANPRSHGKGLSDNRAGFWRYRVGSYRVIVSINDDQLIVLAVKVGKRSNVYDE